MLWVSWERGVSQEQTVAINTLKSKGQTQVNKADGTKLIYRVENQAPGNSTWTLKDTAVLFFFNVSFLYCCTCNTRQIG